MQYENIKYGQVGVKKYPVINLVIFGIFALLFLVYLLLSLTIFSQKYSQQSLKRSINDLGIQVGTEENRDLLKNDLVSLSNFAQKNNMIEAKDIKYFSETTVVTVGISDLHPSP